MLISARQLLFGTICLPGDGSEKSCDFQWVGGVGELVGLNDDHVAGGSLLDGEGSVNHLLVEAE